MHLESTAGKAGMSAQDWCYKCVPGALSSREFVAAMRSSRTCTAQAAQSWLRIGAVG